ncbi:hypothetical protein ABPG77_001541 [Micractinium sp. CCAP 211/92]
MPLQPGFEIEINLDTEEGVLSSYRRATEFVKRGREIVGGNKLYGAKEEQGGARLEALAVGSAGEQYQITAELEQHDEKATGSDWATATCTCPFAAGNNLCKHVIALLLARLDRKRAWRPACRHGPAPLPGLTAEAAAPAGAGATAASAPAAAGKAAAPLRAGATAISAPIVAGEAAASAPAAGEAAPRVPAPLAAAPQASSVLLPGSLATQGGKRKRVLPGSLGAAAGQRAGSQAAAAAEPPEQGLPVFAVQQRLRGEELLEDDDEELVRQCHLELSKPRQMAFKQPKESLFQELFG